MKFPDVLEVELGGPKHHDGGVSRNKMALFAYQVHHNHSCIEPMRVWEFGNKINTHDIPSRFGNGEGMELAKQFLF